MPNGMYGGVRGERKSPLLDLKLVEWEFLWLIRICIGVTFYIPVYDAKLFQVLCKLKKPI